jgi:alkylhydroperoxidase family enzyme
MDINSSRGMKAGVDLEKLADMNNYTASPFYTGRERLALEFADRMTRTDMDVTDEFFSLAREEFPDEELVELAGVIALENFRSKFNNAFRIEAQGFCALEK